LSAELDLPQIAAFVTAAEELHLGIGRRVRVAAG
jgi:hypothetical protein